MPLQWQSFAADRCPRRYRRASILARPVMSERGVPIVSFLQPQHGRFRVFLRAEGGWFIHLRPGHRSFILAEYAHDPIPHRPGWFISHAPDYAVLNACPGCGDRRRHPICVVQTCRVRTCHISCDHCQECRDDTGLCCTSCDRHGDACNCFCPCGELCDRCGHCGDWSCDGCDCSGLDRLHGYSYRPIFQIFRASEERLPRPTFGIEVESELCGVQGSSALAMMPEGSIWYAKEDSSIHSGVEFVSHPATFKWWSRANLSWFSELARMGCRSYQTSTCGIHVHTDKASLGETGQAKMLLFFARHPWLIKAWSRRKENLLADWARVELDGPRAIVRKVKSSGEDVGRYVALNLTNRETAEVRIFRGTLQPSSILRNIALVSALSSFVRTTSISSLDVTDFLSHAYLLSRDRGLSPSERSAYKAVHAWTNSLMPLAPVPVAHALTTSSAFFTQ